MLMVVLTFRHSVHIHIHRDYNYHRMPAPWIQINLLQILAILGQSDLKTSQVRACIVPTMHLCVCVNQTRVDEIRVRLMWDSK